MFRICKHCFAPRKGMGLTSPNQDVDTAVLKGDRAQEARNVRSSEAPQRTLHAGVKIREKNNDNENEENFTQILYNIEENDTTMMKDEHD